MNKTIRKLLVLFLVLMLALVCFVACNKNKGDDQKPDPNPVDTVYPNPDSQIIEIASEADLLAVAKSIKDNAQVFASKTYKVTADIALTKDFEPIVNFAGTFDGQFHTISGLTIASEGVNVGFFDKLVAGSSIKNLNIEATSVSNSTPSAQVGILAGTVEGATVSCVTVSGNITVGGNRATAGGIVGSVTDSTFINVKSSASILGAGSVVGGIIGAMNDKAMLVNAFSNATLTATAQIKAKAVGTKVVDSAVAFVLVNEGDVIAKADVDEYGVSYVTGCKVGVAASQMGWNAAWDVTGDTPVIKGSATETSMSVTVDGGNPISVAYGEALPASVLPSVDKDNVAVVGLQYKGEAYYNALPVVNNIALDFVSVDYSAITGEWVSLNADVDNIEIAQNVTIGDKTYSRIYAVSDDGLPVVYLTDSEGAKYRLYIKTLSASEKTANGINVNGASLIALEKANTKGYDAPVFFMPKPASAVGAWKVGQDTVILTSEMVAVSGVNAFRKMTVNSAVGTYKTCLVVDNGTVKKVVDGYTVSAKDDVTVLLNGTTTVEIDKEYYVDSWTNEASDEVIITDANALTVKSTENGTGLFDSAKNTLYVANFLGFDAISGNTVVAYFKAVPVSGKFVSYKDGVVKTLNFIEGKLYIDNATTMTSVSTKIESGDLYITFDNETYKIDGIVLKNQGEGNDFYAEAAVKAFDGTHVLGTTEFVIADGKVITKKAGVAVDTNNLAIVYSNETIELTANNMTFAIVDNKLTVLGYKSDISGSAEVPLNLFSATELARLYNALNGDWIAPSIGTGAYVEMSFDNKVLTVDGNVLSYEIYLSADGYTVNFIMTYEGKQATVVITVGENNDVLRANGAAFGSFMPEILADAVGNYYEFLVGDGSKAPKTIGISTAGTLTINGISYDTGAYKMSMDAGKMILAAGDETVVLNGNKTLTYKGTTYYNYDRVIPTGFDAMYNRASINYYQFGSAEEAIFEVFVGNIGGTVIVEGDDDEDDEIVTVEPVYPLYGFKITVDGTLYTSTSYSWAKNDGIVTLAVAMASADSTKLNVEVTYPYNAGYNTINVKAGNGEAVEYTRADYIEKLAFDYKNGEKEISLSKTGIMTVDGVAKTFTYSYANGKKTFTVDAVNLVIDDNAPEVAKYGTKVMYDARFAHLAGIKLVSITRGAATADREHSLILTENGFLFDGVKVNWKGYSQTSFDGIQFVVKDTVDGVLTDITWKMESQGSIAGVASFGAVFFPNYSGTVVDWNQRWFVPEILLDATSYIDEDNTVILSTNPVYNFEGSGFVPPIISLNSTQYDYRDYTLSFADGVLTVVLDSENTLTFERNEEQIIVKLNGKVAQPYVLLPLSDFAVTKADVFGDTKYSGGNYQVTITDNEIIYDPDAYSPHKITAYSYGLWNDYTVIYFGTYTKKFMAIKATDGRVIPVLQNVIDLVGSFKYGNIDVNVEMDISGETPILKVTHGGTEASEVVIDSKNLPYDSEYFICYTVDSNKYYVVKDCTSNNTGVIVASQDVFEKVGRTSSSLDNCDEKLYVWISQDASHNAILVYNVLSNYSSGNVNTIVTPQAVAGKDNVYSVTYTKGNDEITKYFAHYASSSPTGVILTISEAQLAFIGTHNVDDTTVTISTGVISDSSCFIITYGDAEPVKATWDSTGSQFTFVNNAETYYVFRDNDTVKVVKPNADQMAFLTGYYSFNTLNGGYYDTAKVEFAGGQYVVTYKSNPTTNVSFSADNTRLYFTQNDVEYCIVMINKNASSTSYKAGVVKREVANLINNWQVGDKNLIINLNNSYGTVSIAASYDNTAATEFTIQDDGLILFKLGQSNYCAARLVGEAMQVKENIVDATSAEFGVLGKYVTDRNGDNDITIKVKAYLDSEELAGKFVLTQNGVEVTVYSIDLVMNIITIGSGDTAKYYTICTGSDKAMTELSAADMAMLGTYTIGTDKVVLAPSYSVSYNSRREEYTFSKGFTIKLNDNDAVRFTSFKTDNSEAKKQYIDFVAGGKTYIFFVVTPGESATLTELTAEQLATFKTSVTVDNKSLSFNIVFDEAGAFTLTLAYDGKAITKTDIAGFGFSFTAGEGADQKIYYVCTNGSSAYWVKNDEYAWYTDTVTVGSNTIKVSAGTSSSNKYMVSLDGKTAVTGTFATSGDYGYIKFTVDSDTYILARNTEADNALVLTKLTAEQTAVLNGKSYSVKLLKDNYEFIFASKQNLKPAISVSAQGVVTVGYVYTDATSYSAGTATYAATVEVLNLKAGLGSIDGVLKVTVNVDGTDYVSIVLTQGSYVMSLTEEQYNLFGEFTVDGKALVIGAVSSVKFGVTYDGSSVMGNSWVDTAGTFVGVGVGSPAFLTTIEIDGTTYDAAEFTINGTTYQAYLVNDVMTVREKPAA